MLKEWRSGGRERNGQAMIALVVAALAACGLGAGAAHAAAARVQPGATATQAPSISALLDDALAEGNPGVTDLDAALRQDGVGAFNGDRCEELGAVIQSTLAEDPRSLAANYLRELCALSGGSFLEHEAARRELRVKIASFEQAAGLYVGEKVFELSTMFDVPAYLLATDTELLGSYFDVQGGGRRLYYVVFLRDRKDGRQETVRFVLTSFAARVLGPLALDPAAADSWIARYSPAAVMVSAMTQGDEPSAPALVGMALHIASGADRSMRSAEVRELLERAIGAGSEYGRIFMAQSLLLDDEDATAPARAFELVRQASASGLAEAEVMLAALHEKGIGTGRDPVASREAFARASRALGRARAEFRLSLLYMKHGSLLFDDKLGMRHLESAARSGDVQAENDLGYACQSRAEPSKPKSCLRWYERASSKGNATATLNLALVHQYGRGVPVDTAKARTFFALAISQGNPEAATNLGYLIETEEGAGADLDRVTALYRTAAEWGSPWGENNYGNMLRRGKGVSQDLVESFRWFALSAAQGNMNANIALAEAYENGLGVAPDQAAAAAYYRYAARKDNTVALLRLADMAGQGRGMEKDNDAWRRLLERAAELGSGEAMWRLGEEYLLGGAVAVDRKTGFEWLRRSATTGDEDGIIKLGGHLARDPDPANHEEGIRLLRQQADGGNAEAAYALGYAYQWGNGVEHDYAKAADWYRKGEARGHLRSITALASLARQGLGEPTDPVRARALYARAGELGYAVATCVLGDMVISGEGDKPDPEQGWKIVQQAADAGAPMCQLKLGLAYRYGGDPIKRNLDSARKYLRLAVDQEIEEAEAQLAELSMHEHEDDDDAQRDGKATLTRLADANSSRAQFLLAEACLLGRPWPRDLACARQRFEQADVSGFPAAAPNLGIFNAAGIGGPPDLAAAETWFRKAITQGASHSEYELGRLLLHMEKDIPEAIELLLKDASGDSPTSAYVLQRYCSMHPDCPLAEVRRAALRRQVAGMAVARKNEVAWALATDALSDDVDGRYAIGLLKSLPAKELDNWAVLDTLAAAHARAGQFDRAARVQKDAIARLPETVSRRQRRIFEERLALYEAGKTWDLPY